jgi:hypothetical protein
MMKPFYLQQEILFFTQAAFPLVLRVEIARIGIPVSEHRLLRSIRLDQAVVMGRQKTFGQRTGFRRQNRKGKTVEAHPQIGLAPEHYFVVRRKTEMNSLSHGIPPTSSIISSTHPAPRTFRFVRNAV